MDIDLTLNAFTRPGPVPEPTGEVSDVGPELVALMLETKPEVVSFHFGLHRSGKPSPVACSQALRDDHVERLACTALLTRRSARRRCSRTGRSPRRRHKSPHPAFPAPGPDRTGRNRNYTSQDTSLANTARSTPSRPRAERFRAQADGQFEYCPAPQRRTPWPPAHQGAPATPDPDARSSYAVGPREA